MSEMMKVEAEDPGGLSVVSPIPTASTSELEQTLDSKNLIQQIVVIKEEVPLDWSPILDQQEPDPPVIKEEENKVVTRDEEQQIENKEKPQLSELHQIQNDDKRETEAPTSSSAKQMETEHNGDDCGGAEPETSSDPSGSSQQSKMLVPKKALLMLLNASSCLVTHRQMGQLLKF
ncbi:hypothetical protein ILYODFUR_028175 [Ilyodon furcidens]|uniref:Uncharacterized protein n=1 Tax=Ilyodon furcidens TaxID=33524 RepID=A0ABV0T0W6_9TELE